MPFSYKTVAEIEALSADESLKYKKDMFKQSTKLLAEASDWKYTYQSLVKHMNDMCNALEVELELATLDRIESDDSNYGSVGYIH